MNSLKLIPLMLSLLTFGRSSIAKPEFLVQIPKGCEDKTVCDQKPEDYPHKLVEEAVQTMNATKRLRVPRQLDKKYEASTARNQYGCSEIHKIIQPFTIRSNEKHKVVLQSENFQQTMKQVECVNETAPCYEDIMLKDNRFIAECKNAYGYIKLYVLDEETKSSQVQDIEVPVACTCAVRIVYSE